MTAVYNLLTHGYNLLTGTTGDKLLHLHVLYLMDRWCQIKKQTLKPEKEQFSTTGKMVFILHEHKENQYQKKIKILKYQEFMLLVTDIYKKLF